MSIPELIAALASRQIVEGNPLFTPGIFPSERRHPYLPYRRPDNNIFYPALIDFTLSPLLDRMEPEDRGRVARILTAIRANYPAYESTRQPGLYNFYRTDPPDPYPNGYLLRHIRHFRLAEDADDTVMITSVRDELPEETIDFIRDELVRFSNLGGRKLRHPLKKYASIPAYGVWFGTGAMPVEVDVCVLCNILYFSARANRFGSAADRASLEFIRTAIVDGDIFNHPFLLSYYYPDPTVILYHVARLWSVLPEPGQWLPRRETIAAIERRLGEVDGLLPRILLHTALLKLGEPEPSRLEYTRQELVVAVGEFSFFIAPMLAGTRLRWLNKLAEQRLFQVDYLCPAYYYAVVLEYEVLGIKRNK